MEHILQNRKNAATVHVSILNSFSQALKQTDSKYALNDWHWKVIETLNVNDVSKAEPMTHPKKSYWGNKLAQFRTRLKVQYTML